MNETLQQPPIEIGLTAAIVGVEAEEPAILVAGDGGRQKAQPGLPFGPFDPLAHRTFEMGLRDWVEAQTGLRVGYVEQLYTFGDRGRHARAGDTGPHIVSIGYLALMQMPRAALAATGAAFERWYRFFPWEDWRGSRPRILDDTILPPLVEWAQSSAAAASRAGRSAAASACAFASASAAARGMRRKCSIATSCSTKPG